MSGYIEVLPPKLTGPAHPEWFEARRAGVSASEIAAVLGISPYESPFSLYHRKRGDIGEQADNEAMRWGRRLEAAIADEFQDKHPEFGVLAAGLLAHADRPWQMASPDRLVFEDAIYQLGAHYQTLPPVALLECKTTSHWDPWGEPGSDDIPVHYRAQVLWQLDTTGLQVAYVAVLVGGRSYREYVIEADEADAKLMREAAEAFLERVRDGRPPDVDGTTATLHTLRALHPDLDDDWVCIPNSLAAAFRRAHRSANKAEERKRKLEAQLRQRMGRARFAVGPDGERVAVRSVYDVKEHVRKASTVDKLVLAREKA